RWGRQASHGQLAPGFVANFAIWDAEHPSRWCMTPEEAWAGVTRHAARALGAPGQPRPAGAGLCR
ncbi:hypothetical protein C0U43_28645, partial [Klebsiella pneumoniae]